MLDHRLILPAIVLAIIAGAALAGWHAYHRVHGVTPPPARRRATAAAARPARPPRPRTAPEDARARRNGWAPPAAPKLAMVALTVECAAGDCVSCPGGGCRCPCAHDTRVIVAMNTARARPADPGPIPF
jgi:hypothetical protein